MYQEGGGVPCRGAIRGRKSQDLLLIDARGCWVFELKVS